MTVNIETAIKYMYDLKAKNISYSMTGSRTGSDGTGDCSGTIYQGLLNAGMPSVGWVLNTDSMHSWLEKNNWKQIANQTDWTAKRGDITIFGKRGASGGAAGHVVLWISNTQFIHCTWNNDWDNGVRVDYETNKLFLYEMMWYTYRYNGAASDNSSNKKIIYQDKEGWYQALRDDVYYCEKELKRKSRWNIKKGNVIYVDKIEKTGKNGKYTRAKVDTGRHTRYCTLRDDFWKYLGK